jgi:hypothetical protein
LSQYKVKIDTNKTEKNRIFYYIIIF